MTFAVDVLAYTVAIVFVIGSYWACALGRAEWRIFNAANAVAAPFLMLSSGLHGAWPAFVVSLFFGLVGVAGIVKEGSDRGR